MYEISEVKYLGNRKYLDGSETTSIFVPIKSYGVFPTKIHAKLWYLITMEVLPPGNYTDDHINNQFKFFQKNKYVKITKAE
jgi:hypothetical protein